jgi:hypothetical protein
MPSCTDTGNVRKVTPKRCFYPKEKEQGLVRRACVARCMPGARQTGRRGVGVVRHPKRLDWLDHADVGWITRRAFLPTVYCCTTDLERTIQTVRSLLKLSWCAHRIDGKGCLSVIDPCRLSSLLFAVAARQTTRLLLWRC